MKRGWLFDIFLVCIGIVFGTLLATLVKPIGFLNWLAFSLSFGLPKTVSVDLNIIQFSFNLQVTLSVSVIICILLSLIIGHLIEKR